MSNFIPRVVDTFTTGTEVQDGSMIFDKTSKKIYFDFDGEHKEVKSGANYTAGTGIEIANETIGVADAPTISITEEQVITLEPRTVKLTAEQAALVENTKIDALWMDTSQVPLLHGLKMLFRRNTLNTDQTHWIFTSTDDSPLIYACTYDIATKQVIYKEHAMQHKLTAGPGISIDLGYTISATGGGASNIENGSGTNALQMKSDSEITSFDFTGKNPNATALDPTLTGEIAYGATGDYASAEGGKNAAQGKRAHAEGTTTIAKGKYSHAEGDNSVSLGNDSHAEGYMTVSAGTATHAEGQETQAIGSGSHAEGYGTISNGEHSHAQGESTKANGKNSFASGINSFAGAKNGFVHGENIQQGEGFRDNSVIIGQNNDISGDAWNNLFTVGNGTSSDNRSNAFAVQIDGTILCKNIPAAPTTDGTYRLTCKVVGGVPTYTWEA